MERPTQQETEGRPLDNSWGRPRKDLILTINNWMCTWILPHLGLEMAAAQTEPRPTPGLQFVRIPDAGDPVRLCLDS